MKTLTKQRFCREWLLFLGCLAAGIVIPFILGEAPSGAMFLKPALSIYFAIQIVRSIFWAVKTIENP